MRKKWKLLWMICCVLIIGVGLVCTKKVEEQPTSIEKKKIVIWYWGEDLVEYAEWYTEEINPNIEFKFVPVQSHEYYQKWILTYLSEGELPDIAVLEKSYRENMLNVTDAWEDLSSQPYQVEKNQFFDYIVEQNTNENGELVSIEMGLTPVLLGYKTDVAEDFFGISSPEEMEALFYNWETVLEKGEKLNEERGGHAFLFANADDLIEIVKAHNQKQVVSNQGIVDQEALTRVIAGMKEVYDRKLIDPRLFNDSDGIGATIAGDQVLFTVCPIWAPDYVLRVFDPKAESRWRLMNIPGGNISMGGASLAISSRSLVKEEAFDFIKSTYLSEEGREVIGALSCYKKMNHSEVKTDEELDRYFGGQNITKKYLEAAEDVVNVQATQFSQAENQAIKSAIEIMIAEEATLEMMVEHATQKLNMDIEGFYKK